MNTLVDQVGGVNRASVSDSDNTQRTLADADERYLPENRLILTPTDAGGRPTPAWGSLHAKRAQGLNTVCLVLNAACLAFEL
jgi:hypothetical protein